MILPVILGLIRADSYWYRTISKEDPVWIRLHISNECQTSVFTKTERCSVCDVRENRTL